MKLNDQSQTQSSGYDDKRNSSYGGSDISSSNDSSLNEDQMSGNSAGGYGGPRDFSNSGLRSSGGQQSQEEDKSSGHESLIGQGLKAAKGFVKKED